jgi:hypothetical protein
MTEIIAMAREAGFKLHHNPDLYDCMVASDEAIERFAALVRADERNKLAAWMQAQGYATGHGDTIEGLLKELEWQVRESEREACAKVCDRLEQEAEGTECCKWPTPADCAHTIRARGNT